MYAFSPWERARKSSAKRCPFTKDKYSTSRSRNHTFPIRKMASPELKDTSSTSRERGIMSVKSCRLRSPVYFVPMRKEEWSLAEFIDTGQGTMLKFLGTFACRHAAGSGSRTSQACK